MGFLQHHGIGAATYRATQGGEALGPDEVSQNPGAYAGPFANSANNSFSAAYSAAVDLSAGDSVWIVVCWWNVAAPTTSDHYLVSCCTSAKGWGFDQGASGAMYLSRFGGSAITLASSYYPRYGRNCMVIGKLADGSYVWSLNGQTAGTAGASDGVAVDSECAFYLGRRYDTARNATQSGIIYYAQGTGDITIAQAKAWSAQIFADEAWIPHADVSGHSGLLSLSLVVNDYAGGATMVSGSGSAPITWTKNGTVARVELECEQIWNADAHQDWWWHNAHWSAQGSGVNAYHIRSAFAEVRFTTDAARMAVDAVRTYSFASGSWDGTSNAGITVVTPDGERSVGGRELAAGSKTVRLWDGWQGHASPNVGVFMQRVRFPASASVTLVRPSQTEATHKLVIIGDSISGGSGLTDAERTGFFALMGRVGGGSFGGDVQHEGASGLSLYELLHEEWAGAAALASAIADACAGYDTVTLVNQLGINDYNQNMSASSYQTHLEELWDALHSALPDAACYQCLCFLYSTKEATPNGAGSVPPDFRTAQGTVQSARSSWLTNIDTYTMCADPPDFLADHLHLTAAGSAVAEAGIRAAVTAGGDWY